MNTLENSLKLELLVTEIVSAYVSNHEMKSSDLPSFMLLINKSLKSLNTTSSYVHTTRGAPAVSIEDSIQPDYIVCLEDGRRMKLLKRHLKTAYKMTPEQYRERWNLPQSYPMVAPNYAIKRTAIAKSIGLGSFRKKIAA